MALNRSCAKRSVWVASDAENAFVVIAERATFAIGPCFKQLGEALIDRRCRRLVIDMAKCSGVDSTFLGVLAGLALRMSRDPGSRMIMINLPPPIYESVCTLGLNRLIDCYEAGKCPAEIQEHLGRLGSLDLMEIGPADPKTARETAIEAHETLVRSDPSNLPRFKDVLTFLREGSH